MSRRLVMTLVAAAGFAAALPVSAQFQKTEDAIKYRQAAFTVMGNHMGRIGAMVNNRVPFDAAAVQANADIVATMSRLPYAGFVPDSAANTKARPEIWTEPEKFRAAAVKMQEEVVKLSAAAKTGNQDQIKAAFGSVGQSCKACHDNFRKE